jgi:hypothetical protein
VFLGNAGNYFLLGNDGEGPITKAGPGSADGELMQAAPDLLKALRLTGEAISRVSENIMDYAGPEATLHVPMTRAEIEAIRAALAKVED